jgi:hypothetical protein
MTSRYWLGVFASALTITAVLYLAAIVLTVAVQR